MSAAKLQWYVLENESYTIKNDHYAGSVACGETLRVTVQVWNNRWGVSSIDAINDVVINFRFGHLEDAALLPYCRLVLDSQDDIPLLIQENSAIAVLGRSLSGDANDGDAEMLANKENFLKLLFEFSLPITANIKSNDLKQLYFDITPLDS